MYSVHPIVTRKTTRDANQKQHDQNTLLLSVNDLPLLDDRARVFVLNDPSLKKENERLKDAIQHLRFTLEAMRSQRNRLHKENILLCRTVDNLVARLDAPHPARTKQDPKCKQD